MVLGLISDTHDHVPHIEKAANIFKEKNVDMVLHAGDFCSPFTIPPFEGLNLKGVFGNNDGDHYLILQKFSEIGATHLGSFGKVEVGNKTIGLYHGTDVPVTEALEQCGNYDVVISGHTHEKKVEFIGNTLAINPGAAHGFEDEATIALLDTQTMDVSFLTLN